jgi:hypothetical protein
MEKYAGIRPWCFYARTCISYVMKPARKWPERNWGAIVRDDPVLDMAERLGVFLSDRHADRSHKPSAEHIP